MNRGHEPPSNGTAPEAPNDIDAERIVLGACLWSTSSLTAARQHITSHHAFYRPAHQTLWQLLCTAQDFGQPIQPETAWKHVSDVGIPGVDGPYVFDLLEVRAPNEATAASYAQTITGHARKRAWLEHAAHIAARAAAPDVEPDELDVYGNAIIENAVAAHERHSTVELTDLDAFLDTDEPAYRWLIPGLLEHQDRVILTGGEGSGKTTLARQVAVTAAAGIHPFTGAAITPLRVAMLDLENPSSLVRRELGRLRAKAGNHLARNQLFIESRPAGLNILDAEDRDWLTGWVTAVRPDILVAGPLYKLADGNPNREEETKPVAMLLDRIRADTDCALWLEAHVGNEREGSAKRLQRPVGWSGWRRWPEFGLFLDRDGSLHHWRGDRDQRNWPSILKRGDGWPWTPVSDEVEMRWLGIKKTRADFGQYMSFNDLMAATGIARGTLQRVIGKGGRYGDEWARLNGKDVS